MGAPHGRAAASSRPSSAASSPLRGRGSSSQLTKPTPQTSFLSSLTGLLSGVKHTASRGVNSFLDSVLASKASRRRGFGAIEKGSSAHVLRRRNVPVRRDLPAQRRIGQMALKALQEQQQEDGLLEEAEDNLENHRVVGANRMVGSVMVTPAKGGAKRSVASDGVESESKRLKEDEAAKAAAAARIAELERKVARMEHVFATSFITQTQTAAAAAGPIPPPLPPPPPPHSSHNFGSPPPARDPVNAAQFVNMRKLMDEMKTVKLRRTDVTRSPGGTIHSTCPPDPNDHQQIITNALRGKFRNLRAESPEPCDSSSS
ncbi:hypothetical protein HDU87_006392 [Geranomyces variabilis]|uniref:Uncharacterized protein n=1 Tax=Geranomyces variabilis TaxID=109894 RepID=A0AAD5TG19_9FUNG|nr:hypothetical protein HDU87_006392 [Geranomyces variabilis]